MERYSKPLSGHVRLVHEHAAFLVERLLKYSIRLKSAKKDDYQSVILHKMKSIQEELMVIEDYIKENWPGIVEIFDILKNVKCEEEKDDENFEQND